MATTQGIMSGAVQPLTEETKATNDLQTQTFPSNPLTASTAGATGYTASTRTVDPTKETVQGQMTGIMSSESPLVQMGRTKAKEAANSAGLLNSSMALQASDAAAYQVALPIAQADASTYSTAAAQNQAAENTTNQFNASSLNTTSQFNADASNKMALQAMDSNTKASLAQTEASYKTLMQTNASASDFYKQIVKNMTDIMGSSTMGAAAKQTAIDNQTQMLKSGLDVIGKVSNLDLSGLLDFSELSGSSQGAPIVENYTAPDGSIWSSQAAYEESVRQRRAAQTITWPGNDGGAASGGSAGGSAGDAAGW